MSYAALCVIFANAVIVPVWGALFFVMGRKNWLPWLLIIPSIVLMDLDHFILTNVPGFGAHPMYSGQKILHVAHTVEWVVLEILVLLLFFLKIDVRGGRSLKDWFFPVSTDYSSSVSFHLAWTVRILALGVDIHWMLDLLIYIYFHKWRYLYISLIGYFLNPT